MNVVRTEAPNVGAAASLTQNELIARQTAMEFEALLLTQLTAALHSSPDEAEDNVFSSTGADMYKQMFSEQIAKIMANNGGIGVANTILQQLRDKATAKSLALERAIQTALAVQKEASAIPAVKINAVTEADEMPTAWQAPLQGRITSEFGLRTDPINGQQKSHHGIDIAAPRGTPIGAAAAGTVVFAGRRGGYGNTVIVEQRDGKQTLYAHAEQLMVNAGDVVEAGQTIATVGSTGRSTGPHLHFEVRENGQPIDPTATFTKGFTFARR
ncbi:MAG TPA: peptidoglycan DD-metalloendopeptidase family protein [Blastocatellia bacterium]|nr:peptidoglycan DD-metalloendopeptidase family protein [Blastocatellia bacterium]